MVDSILFGDYLREWRKYLSEEEIVKYTPVLKEWFEHIQPVERPSWDEYFMSLAILASSRSMDAQSKFGCVLVKDKRVLSIGYNSSPGKMDDSLLPNLRPTKYKFMVHAELNALNLCNNRPDGATAYVTGIPCSVCLRSLYQSGVREIVCLNVLANMQKDDPEEELTFNTIVKMGKMSVRFIRLDKEKLLGVFTNSLNRLGV